MYDPIKRLIYSYQRHLHNIPFVGSDISAEHCSAETLQKNKNSILILF